MTNANGTTPDEVRFIRRERINECLHFYGVTMQAPILHLIKNYVRVSECLAEIRATEEATK